MVAVLLHLGLRWDVCRLVGGSLRLGLSSGFVSGLCLVGVRGGVVALWVLAGWVLGFCMH